MLLQEIEDVSVFCFSWEEPIRSGVLWRTHSLSLPRARDPARLTPLHPTAAALAVALEFAPQSFSDTQIGSAPETIHLTGEVGGDLRGADHQQHQLSRIAFDVCVVGSQGSRLLMHHVHQCAEELTETLRKHLLVSDFKL